MRQCPRRGLACSGCDGVRVLIDNSVWKAARKLVHEADFSDVVSEQFGIQRRWSGFRVEHRKNGWIYNQIEWLPTVRMIFLENKAIPFEDVMVSAEAWRGARFPNSSFGDLLSGVFAKKIQWPIKIPDYLLETQYLQNESGYLIRQQKKVDQDWDLAARALAAWLLRQTDESVGYLKKFEKIGVLDTHAADSLQYWSCLVGGLDVYLTLDKKFRNNIKNSNTQFETKILFPSEFCNLIGITNPLPMPYNYGDVFDALGRIC